MKSYTDLEQSKKLAKILSIESADMYYCYGMDIDTKVWSLDNTPTIIDADNQIDIGDIPCWSLPALLNIIPDSIYDNTDEFSQLEFSKISVAYHDMNDGIKIGSIKDNLIDAAYEMIVKLHEHKLL